MNFLKTLLIGAFLLVMLTPITAQDPPLYVNVNFMKVAFGDGEDYEKLEEIWKKIHGERIKSGQLYNWALYRVISPSGSASEYNYIAMNIYNSEKQLAGHFEGAMIGDHLKVLTDEEKEWVKRTGDLRTLVKEEVFQRRMHTKVDGDLEKYIRVNYMKPNEGFTRRDMGEREGEYWKPVHEMAIEQGMLLNWGMYSLEIPYGKNLEYSVVTVDFYKSMEQMLTTDYGSLFPLVHKEKSMEEVMKETRKAGDLVKSEIWKLIDFTATN